MARSNKCPDAWSSWLKRLGFTIEEQLGRGSFGKVYKARQRALPRPVAVKFFTTFRSDEETRKRFEREAPLLAKVEHPSVPYVITRGTVPKEETPFIVMQYIPGKTLAQVIREKNTMTASEAVAIMGPVLQAIAACHEQSIIHRDVKPDNIVIGPHGPVLIDFSIGISLEYEPGLTRLTTRGQRIGDADYASPEQVKDSSTVDGRTDIYSAGLVLLEMLTGRTRVSHNNIERILQQAGHDDLVIPVWRACHPNLDLRFKSAAEFLAAINPGGTPIPESKVALCPRPGCSSGNFSASGYFRGPHVFTDYVYRHCQSCGGQLIRGCPACGLALNDDAGDYVVTKTRASEDRRTLHCRACGTLIYETPICKKRNCGSLLTQEDLDKDTAKEGCQKCRAAAERAANLSRRSAPPASVPYTDDDIPF